jgi:hypothetical protein
MNRHTYRIVVAQSGPVLGLITVSAALFSCSAAQSEHHTVSWYQAHKQELSAKLTWCGDDQARKEDIDCKNALQAGVLNQVAPVAGPRPDFGPPAMDTKTSP